MPLAMAALDLAGAIRERSPTDTAIFGEAAARLAERFAVPDEAVALLARAVSEGTAETVAWLSTAAGRGRFRVSLWRQRGGERIRILACFAEQAPGPAPSGSEDGFPHRAAVSWIGAEMRAPLAAVAEFAEALRAGTGGMEPGAVAAHASDIVAAAWRLQGLHSDLLSALVSQDATPPARLAEVDVVRLVRRIARLVAPSARASGVALDLGGLPEAGRGVSVLGDESGLWGVIEALVVDAVGRGGSSVAVSMTALGGGQVLEIAETGAGREAEAAKGAAGNLALWREVLHDNGAELEIAGGAEEGFRARIVFPAARCLNPA